MRAVLAVELIVSAHDGGGLCFERYFKRSKIYFVERARVDDRIGIHAQCFGIVGGKVLDARADARRLHARYERLAERARQIRVFRKIFKIPAAKRRAFYIKPGREQKVYADRGRFRADSRAHVVQQSRIPAVGEHGRRGKERRRQCRRAAVGHSQPARSVGSPDARKLRRAERVPHIVAGQHAQLLLECERAERFFYV